MTDASDAASKALQRFEERAGSAEEPAPVEEQLAAAAEAVEEVGDEQLEVPPGILRGIVLFELEDGSFGSRPIEGTSTSMDDAVDLAERFARRGRLQLTAEAVFQRLAAAGSQVRSQQLGKAVAAKAARNLFGVRRAQ